MSISDLEIFADIALSFITVLAILIGGFWSYVLFVKRRQDFPRAKIEHRVTSKVIHGEMILLSIDVFIHNTGDVLIRLLPWSITVNQMLPPRSELLRFIEENNNSNGYGREIVEWSIIASKKETVEIERCEIEPGEYEQFHYDFWVNFKVTTILLESYFQNQKRHNVPSIGWRLITIHDLDNTEEPIRNDNRDDQK